ncbi:MAG: pyridoxamine 5'-phosphate oxidase family protein [Thermomicrobiales bacterium]
MSTNLDDLLQQSRSRAGADLRGLIDQPERHMNAAAFRAFVDEVRLWAMATSGKNGSPHIAPVHMSITDDDELQMTIHVESVRMRDIDRDPRVAFTGWAEGGRMAIIYGEASVIPGSERVSGAGGREKPVVRLKITPTRIYAMDPARFLTRVITNLS